MFGRHARRRLTATIVLAVLMLYPYALTADRRAGDHYRPRSAPGAADRRGRRAGAGTLYPEQTQREDVLVSDGPWLSLCRRSDVGLAAGRQEQLTVLRAVCMSIGCC
jgi:hypothetical protein